MNSAEWSDRSGQSHTFAFADLAGFTALTEAHGDEQAADLAGEFSRTAAELLTRHGAEQIKTIGDALMLRIAEPAEAVTLGLALTSELMAEHGYPAIRVGMHTGPAVERSGDWFGAAVNLAARISGLAAGNEVLLSQATMAQAGEVDGVRFDERGQQRLRNVSEPITIFDPVCRMAIDRCMGGRAKNACERSDPMTADRGHQRDRVWRLGKGCMVGAQEARPKRHEESGTHRPRRKTRRSRPL